jgi:hypothetical protein
MGSTQPLILGTEALSQGAKQLESEADSSSPSKAIVEMCGEIDTSTPLYLDGMMLI